MISISDTSKIKASFNNKAAQYDRHVLVQKRVVSQLVNTIEGHLFETPRQILDVGTGTGAMLEKLHLLFPEAGMTGIDIAPNMCHQAEQKLGASADIVNCDATELPFISGKFDLIVSASALQWVGDLSSALFEMRRVIRKGGQISLAFFTAGTLFELHECFTEVYGVTVSENSQTTSRLHTFRTLEEVTATVKQINFDRFIITVETEIDWYDDLNSLLRSIKNIGAGSVSGKGEKGLGWRGILNETSLLYQKKYGKEGRIPVTYKVLYLTASVD